MPRLPGASKQAMVFIVRIADQDAVLEVVDQVIADVELGEAVAEQRMLDRAAKFPGLLRHQVGIAGIDAIGREFGRADEVVEIELGDGALGRQSAPCQPLPSFQSSVRLGFQNLRGSRSSVDVAANRDLGIFIG